jgi:hypothetical protein
VRVEVSCVWPVLATQLIVFWAERTGWEERAVEPGSDPEWWWLPAWHGPYPDLLFDEDWVTAADKADFYALPSTGFLATLHTPLELLWEDSRNRQSTGTAFVRRLLVEMSSVIYTFLQAMQYLGPMRPEPERLYRFNAIDVAAWRKRGWGSYLDFLSLQMSDTSLIDQIGKWLDFLDLGPAIRPEATHLGLGILSQISVFEEQDGISFNLRDVGYGVAQVFPILVHSLMARPGSLVIIEQPELHLHPRAQAQLADLFIRVVPQ